MKSDGNEKNDQRTSRDGKGRNGILWHNFGLVREYDTQGWLAVGRGRSVMEMIKTMSRWQVWAEQQTLDGGMALGQRSEHSTRRVLLACLRSQCKSTDRPLPLV